MAALREAGAVGFSDDGLPIADAGVMRRALQYQHLVGGTILLHEEDPALTGDGVMGEGAVSAALGLAGVPDVSESTMIARDGALCLYEDARAHVQHLSARASVEAVAVAKAGRRAADGRADAAPPRPHRRGGPQPRRPLQDEPAAADRGRPPGADRGAAQRRRRLHRHRPRPARVEREGGALRGRQHGRDRARDGLRGPLHRARRARRRRPRPDRRADGSRAPSSSTSSRRGSRPTPRRTSSSSTSTPSGRPAPTAGRAARTTPASRAAGCARGR